MIYLLLLINIVLLVSGQLLWKVAVSNVSSWNLQTALHVVFSPYFIGGGLLYVAATGLWIVILSKMPLSIAYPFQSICYILGMIAAFFLFKEVVTPTQWIGAAVLIVGVFLIAK